MQSGKFTGIKRQMLAAPDLWKFFLHLLFRTKRKLRALNRTRVHNQVLSNSSLFDRRWYLETYPDVAESMVDPVNHYLRRGASEGRDPGPHFSTRAYYALHKDVKAAGVNALLHYLMYGRDERRVVYSAEEGRLALSRQDPNGLPGDGKRFLPAAPSVRPGGGREEPATASVYRVSFPLVRTRPRPWNAHSVFCPVKGLNQIGLGGIVLGTVAEETSSETVALKEDVVGVLEDFCRMNGVEADGIVQDYGAKTAGLTQFRKRPVVDGGEPVASALERFGNYGLEFRHAGGKTLQVRTGKSKTLTGTVFIRLFQFDPKERGDLLLLSETTVDTTGGRTMDISLADAAGPVLACLNMETGHLMAIAVVPLTV